VRFGQTLGAAVHFSGHFYSTMIIDDLGERDVYYINSELRQPG